MEDRGIKTTQFPADSNYILDNQPKLMIIYSANKIADTA